MLHVLRASTVFVLLAAPGARAADGYKVELIKTPNPGAGSAHRPATGPGMHQVKDAGGQILCNLWLCKEVPGEPAAAKGALTYRELKETCLVGALQVVKPGFTDYRKQAIKPGVYTLRLGFQPMDGDHMGTAPFNEFCLLSPAADDKSAAPLENAKALTELSGKASGTGHPGVLLLFPAKPTGPPEIVRHETLENHWIVNWKVDVSVDKKMVPLGIGLAVVGKTSA